MDWAKALAFPPAKAGGNSIGIQLVFNVEKFFFG
jgi:hypothetical protein